MTQLPHILKAVLLLVGIISCFYFFNGVIKTEKEPTVVEQSKFAPKNIIDNYNEAGEKYPAGKALFQQKCAACHSIIKDDADLSRVLERGPWNDRSILKAFIRNPEVFMQTNDYARLLMEKYRSLMPAFPELSDPEIDAIIAYLDATAQAVN